MSVPPYYPYSPPNFYEKHCCCTCKPMLYTNIEGEAKQREFQRFLKIIEDILLRLEKLESIVNKNENQGE